MNDRSTKGDNKRQGAPVVLITGSSGTVGRSIATASEAAGWIVSGVDIVAGPYTQLVGDLRDRALLRRALDKADVVVHLAALHAPHVGEVADAEFGRSMSS